MRLKTEGKIVPPAGARGRMCAHALFLYLLRSHFLCVPVEFALEARVTLICICNYPSHGCGQCLLSQTALIARLTWPHGGLKVTFLKIKVPITICSEGIYLRVIKRLEKDLERWSILCQQLVQNYIRVAFSIKQLNFQAKNSNLSENS